jgi:hypothetical protein
MTVRRLLLFTALGAALSLTPARAFDFGLAGSYWNTDAAGDAAGGTVILGLPVNETFGFELRGSYFEELSDDPFENAFDSDDEVFQDKGIQVTPIEAGLLFRFAPGTTFRPYVGGGASYFLIDSDFGEIDDELGYYAVVGATFGDDDGAQLFVEANWRKATAEVRVDPEDLDDIDDLEIDDHADLDLDGFGANLGVRWTF